MANLRTKITCAACGAVHLDRFTNCRQCGHDLTPETDEPNSAITLTRRDIKALRIVCRQTLNMTRRDEPLVHLRGRSDGLTVRCANNRGAVEWHAAGELPDWDVWVPWTLFSDCEGNKHDPVRLQRHDEETLLASWSEDGVSRVRQYEIGTPEECDAPLTPESLRSNDPSLLAALREAMETVDADATRYATNCVQLDGEQGRAAATDSRQLLIQDGFDFPWDDKILLPHSKVFGSSWLPQNEPVQVAKTEHWLTLCVGAWTIHLRLQEEGRFPDVESVIPDVNRVSTRLHFDAADATFLTKAVDRLPASDDFHSPVTLDLNGHVLVRATADDQPHPTELRLTNSHITGEPLSTNTNRTYLRRAMKLGFRQAWFCGPETPVLCQDSHRSYVWMVLGREGAVQRSEAANRIASPVSATSDGFRDQANASPETELTQTPARLTPRGDVRRAQTTRSTPSMQKHTNERSSRGNRSANSATSSAIDEAETLRGTLQAALTQTRNLITALKQQRKQSKTVQSALASLRQLQNLPG